MATSPAASSSSAPTAAAAAAMAAEATDGPVLSVVSKRLRALRKKYNRITQMEESLAAGKTLNREQEEVLRSKPVVAALIDELERLRPPLASAVAEELSSRPAPAPAPAPAASSSDSDSSVQDLLALVYFGSLFDVKQQSDYVSLVYTRELERNSCLTYDYVGDDPEDSLAEADLNAVAALASLAASRPPAAAGVSHRDALQACAHHARLWLRRADEPIHPDSSITYAGVRAKLDRIMASGYYTAQLEMTPLDLAAAVASFGAGGMQVQESTVVSPQAPEAVDESHAVEGHKDEKEDSQATEIYSDHQDPVVDVEHVEDEGLVNPTDEVPSAEAEQETFDADVEDHQEQKDQQFTQRRSYQNQRGGGRGGGRRGYPNGRGGRGGRGGGYQNGRGGGGYQNGRGGGGGYYYESGYYQPRNYNNRGRGGRSGGGNSYYNNHGGGSQGGGHGHPGRVELGANA